MFIGLLPACDMNAPPPSDPELRAQLAIPDDVQVHRIDLTGQRDRTRVLPRSTGIRSGDIVQFVVLDHRVYLIRFDESRIELDGLEFLRSTGQDRPPPLLEQGARLVLSFEDAPNGSYPFVVDGSGPAVTGEIRVSDPQS